MNTIQIVGMGVGNIEDLTIKAYNALTSGIPNYVRTIRHPVTKQLKEKDIKIETFDDYFEKYDSFDEVYDEITAKIVELSEKYGKINYCTAGSPFYGDIVTKKLLCEYKDEINIIIIDGMSFLDKCIKLSGFSDYKSISILDSLEVDEFSFNVNSLNIITQVYDREIASQLKIILMEVYEDDILVQKIDVLEEKIEKVPLFLIDQEKKYGFSTYFCINPIEISENTVYNINNLCRTIRTLRGPDGCPWDIKQTHESIRQCVIEEAYEVVDAIDNNDIDNLVEELGDLLLQVVFHAEIASEDGFFNFKDVVSNVCNKMYSRHPHVFGNKKANNVDEALKNWETAKQKEKKLSNYTDNLKNVPKSLSPLSRSYKIQKRAADVGFDWPDEVGAITKIKEELFEFIEEYKKLDLDKMESEFGDLIFAMVNFARFMKINPDIALNRTINKFINRFEFIEKNATKDLKQMTLEEMDELWEKSKIPNGI
ncbi:tetrapyrrole methylase family protein/MazG family protein [Sedimentibacter acidaminivorans]|uniref:Tetrapyrrole methylase family protein/MazG family protein n=1 Tax=Sedimentibacter acidaminivorans TaxID=913099 RepID=A0ABS4GEV0_9FIRM|nr:nucleoside triphosphate pyrophosphohydrolase [Sedimentibacter acidaminivorans]MBP1926228.1 tetrapyrrole methylase family protein/MazG family protein [Sedimentibacter acidaminivorans]